MDGMQIAGIASLAAVAVLALLTLSRAGRRSPFMQKVTTSFFLKSAAIWLAIGLGAFGLYVLLYPESR